MTIKGDAIRAVLDRYPDAAAQEIADIVLSEYGISVAAGSVRSVKSRDNASGGYTAARADAGRDNYRPRARVLTSVPSEPAARYPGDPGTRDDIDYPVTGFAPVITGVVMPRPPVGLGREREAREQIADEEFFRWFDEVENALRHLPQSITDFPPLISMIREICDDPELRAANKARPFTVDIKNNPDGTQTLTIVSAKAATPYRAPSRRQRKEPQCEFCRNIVPGQNLYLVSSPPLGERPRLLCAMHAEPETRIGASVVPYKVESESGIYGMILTPPKTPMQIYRDRIMSAGRSAYAEISSAAGRLQGYPDSE